VVVDGARAATFSLPAVGTRDPLGLPPRRRDMRTRHSGRFFRWLSAGVTAGSVLGLAAGCGQAAGGHGSGGEVIYSARYQGPVLVSADGRTITVGGYPAPCFGTVQPVAKETGQRVQVWLRYVAPRRHGVCNKDMGLILARQIRLPAPVGHRELVSGANGPALAVFSTRDMLHPVLPAGYRLQYVSPVVGIGLASPQQPAGCTQVFSSATATLTIVQSRGHLALPLTGGRHPVAISVRGHRGEATVNAITWSEHGQQVLITVVPGSGAGQVLTTQQLIALAGHLPLGGTR
jgi:hypothetical protein